MIGYEMDSSPAGVYSMIKTSPVENFKHGNEKEKEMTRLSAW